MRHVHMHWSWQKKKDDPDQNLNQTLQRFKLAEQAKCQHQPKRQRKNQCQYKNFKSGGKTCQK